MRFNTLISSSILFLSLARSAYCLSDPPKGAIVIGKDQRYQTLTAALKDTSSNIYFVKAGSYNEQVVINRRFIRIYGESPHTRTYASNRVTITNNIPASSVRGNDESGTVRVLASNVRIYNLNIANTYGKHGYESQAIALSVQAGQFGCYACNLTGYQDTLLANKGSQFYGMGYIEGAVDIMFGRLASVWVTNSTIHTIGDGCITASGRSFNDNTYYVINKCTITGVGKPCLGRPWGELARVVIQHTNIGSHIISAGWTKWSEQEPHTGRTDFREYKNIGPGAETKDRQYLNRTGTGVSISEVLTQTHWIDPDFL